MKLVRLAIWLATGGFVFMLFYPLVVQMFDRLQASSTTVLP